MHGEQGGVLGLPFHLDEIALGEFLKDAFEGGDRDMSQACEIFVADGATGFVFGMGDPPQPEVHDLFRRGEIWEDLVEHIQHSFVVW